MYKFYGKQSAFMVESDFRNVLIKQFLNCVAAVNTAKLIGENMKIQEEKLQVCNKTYSINNGNVYLIGFGKAVLGMASQCEKILGKHLQRGIICVPENTQKTFKNNSDFSFRANSVIEVYEGARNNLPDEKAEKCTDKIIELVKSLDSAKDNLIVLISGGGSALFTKPSLEISLAEKLETIMQLTSLGANITQLNTVRKKLSQVKGGGLACLSYPVRTICLILSDVINDPLDIIASGPTVPNSDVDSAAFDILQKYSLENKVPKNVLKVTKKTLSGMNIPLGKNGFPHVDNFVIGNNKKALIAAKEFTEVLGFKSVIISSKINGSVESVSNFYVNLLFEILTQFQNENSYKSFSKENVFKGFSFDNESNFIDELNKAIKELSEPKRICIIAGGETTVKLKGNGRGGRNQELALIISNKIHELKTKYSHLFVKYGVTFLIAGTDGIDGPTDAAGALGETHVIEKAKKFNLNVNEFLLKNDSYSFFEKLDYGSYLIKTGLTGTNVMDIHSFIIHENLLPC